MNVTAHTIEHIQGSDLYSLRATQVAEALCMTVPTYERRLRAEGSTFKGMRIQERTRRVLVALRDNPRLTCKDLAHIAGYAEQQTLIKAFQVWTGMTLTEYKTWSLPLA